jgi:hypothetical protein
MTVLAHKPLNEDRAGCKCNQPTAFDIFKQWISMELQASELLLVLLLLLRLQVLWQRRMLWLPL